MCKLRWKVLDVRIWWWDEIEWQKSAHSVINEAVRVQKMLWWKILLRWIFENLYGCTPLHWGHPHLTSHKFENSPFKRYEWRYNPIQKRNSPDLNRLPNTQSWNSRIVPNSIPQPYCPDVQMSAGFSAIWCKQKTARPQLKRPPSRGQRFGTLVRREFQLRTWSEDASRNFWAWSSRGFCVEVLGSAAYPLP